MSKVQTSGLLMNHEKNDCSRHSEHGFNPSMAFTTISTVRVLQEVLRLLPLTLIQFSQSLTSLPRLEKFLWSEELQENVVLKLTGPEVDAAISVEGGSFTWDVESDSRPSLEDISLKIKPGSVVAVVGRVGSGISSLLSALQGEIPRVAGTAMTWGSTTCVNQTAWIQNATIQECILFGLPMDKERYDRTCGACALVSDLTQMESGDQTEIGEQGINLSGGQKQRIQLSRAIYEDSDIYFLDDVFSAVDAHTGSHLFKECVLGALRGKTMVLVTHEIKFLPQVDLVLITLTGGDYWVAYEADFTSEETSKAKRFIFIYAALAFSSAILVFMRTLVVALFGLVTTQILFLGMLRSIFRAPMSFFDTTPNGRDLTLID